MKLISFLFFIFSINLFAQEVDLEEFEIEDVTKEELLQSYHPKDSSAPAATLFKIGYLTMRYDDGWVYKLEITKRIKIYNQEGYDYATIKIPYYYGRKNENRENIKKVKAYVYNLEGKKIVDDKIKNRDIIDEQSTELWNQVKFTFPNIKPGSIIEYSYIYESPNISELPEWFFQEEIPVNYSKYEMVIPEYFGYKPKVKGYHRIHRAQEYTSYEMAYRVEGTSDSYGIGTNVNTSTGTSTEQGIKYTYVALNVPKLKDEPFVNNHDNFLTSIKHEMSYYKDPTYNTYKEFTTTWKDVALTLQKSENFGGELSRTGYFEDDIDAIISSSKTDDEKLMRIFNHVKQHMTWNDYLGIYSSDRLNKVYKERTGNIASINLMLTSMLRYAGFESNPVLVSTVANGIPGNSPSTGDFNYLISSVEFGSGNFILLDASNPFTGPNLLPTYILNWHGRLVRPNGTSKQVNLNPKELSKDNFIMNINLHPDGKLDGQMRRQYTDQYAFRYRMNYSSSDKDDYVNKLQNKLGINITSYESKNIDNLAEPVIETLAFENDGSVDVINDNLYLSPLLFLVQDENPFKQNTQERKLPIDFTFPKSQKYMINVKLPEGYEVEYIPESVAVALPNDKGLYRFNMKKSPTGDIQIVVSKELKQSILGPEYYKPLKDFYKTIVEKETDKIVLKKI